MVMNSRSVLERKLFNMFIYTTCWKDEFFQRHLRVKTVRIEKSAVEARKVRISAKIDIQKIYHFRKSISQATC